MLLFYVDYEIHDNGAKTIKSTLGKVQRMRKVMDGQLNLGNAVNDMARCAIIVKNDKEVPDLVGFLKSYFNVIELDTDRGHIHFSKNGINCEIAISSEQKKKALDINLAYHHKWRDRKNEIKETDSDYQDWLHEKTERDRTWDSYYNADHAIYLREQLEKIGNDVKMSANQETASEIEQELYAALNEPLVFDEKGKLNKDATRPNAEIVRLYAQEVQRKLVGAVEKLMKVYVEKGKPSVEESNKSNN